MTLTQTQLDTFYRDGYLIIPDVFSAEEMDAACAAMEQIFYGKPFVEWREDFEAGQTDKKVSDGFTTTHNHSEGRSQFPVGMDALDRLIENKTYLDIFEQLLGDKATYCNAHLFMRSGPTDKRHAEHPWEGYHIDHYTNCLLPPFHDTGRFDYVNSGAYLHDVEEDGAPMLVIPGSHVQAADTFSRGFSADNVAGGSLKDIRKAPELAPPKRATGTRGSAAFYSSYLIHAAQPFQNKRKQRAFWTLSMCRRDNDRWTRFSNPFIYGERNFMMPFFTKTTPRVRSLFGWPEPGHPYYTPQTVGLIEQTYPGIDMTPYR
ncbi:MAG: phytanoyl-CoA dioxygenase family protein [candidate division Zixibacteria bacterium]|nr:phytanoyl-CoA dioxygenase family protein [candidate division Zixibacteria bacterium]